MSEKIVQLLWNDFCQEANFLSKANICARACEKSQDNQNSGIGHSVIRGLVTTGQWSARSSTVFSRGSRKCHHSQYVDSWTIFMCSAPHKCPRPRDLNRIHPLLTFYYGLGTGSRTKPRSGAKHPWRTDFYAIRSIKESCTRNVICTNYIFPWLL